MSNIEILFFQFLLNVRDGGNPARSASVTVTINVIRDLHDPVFSQNGYYYVPFSYLTTVNQVLVNVSATDSDTDVSIAVFVLVHFFIIVCLQKI
jgi:hypothetical protein